MRVKIDWKGGGLVECYTTLPIYLRLISFIEFGDLHVVIEYWF